MRFGQTRGLRSTRQLRFQDGQQRGPYRWGSTGSAWGKGHLAQGREAGDHKSLSGRLFLRVVKFLPFGHYLLTEFIRSIREISKPCHMLDSVFGANGFLRFMSVHQLIFRCNAATANFFYSNIAANGNVT